MRLLIVDDNQNLVANLFDYFEPRGHVLDAAPDGVVGLYLARTHDYDAIVLDWMLPRMDGLTVLQALRSDPAFTVPVIMLTARGELVDKLAGFQAGADDYLTKPFALPELEARLLALSVRASRTSPAQNLCVHDLHFNPQTLVTQRAGQALHLYPASRKLLELLMRASPAAVPRERLEQALWGDAPPDGDMLRSHIYELRRVIDGPFATKLLHTVPRVGYRLALPAEDAAS